MPLLFFCHADGGEDVGLEGGDNRQSVFSAAALLQGEHHTGCESQLFEVNESCVIFVVFVAVSHKDQVGQEDSNVRHTRCLGLFQRPSVRGKVVFVGHELV